MATSRSTAKKAEERRISQIGDFKNRMGGIFELPSGANVRLRNPGGLQVFLANGTIPNSLLPIIEQALKGSKQAQDETAEAMTSLLTTKPEAMAEMMALYDNVLLKVVVEPRVHAVPTWDDVEQNNKQFPEAPADDPEDLRREDRLYVDEFPDEDKQFIFQWVTSGNSDLATFRERHSKSMATLAAGGGVSDNAK